MQRRGAETPAPLHSSTGWWLQLHLGSEGPSHRWWSCWFSGCHGPRIRHLPSPRGDLWLPGTQSLPLWTHLKTIPQHTHTFRVFRALAQESYGHTWVLVLDTPLKSGVTLGKLPFWASVSLCIKWGLHKNLLHEIVAVIKGNNIQKAPNSKFCIQ